MRVRQLDFHSKDEDIADNGQEVEARQKAMKGSWTVPLIPVIQTLAIL